VDSPAAPIAQQLLAHLTWPGKPSAARNRISIVDHDCTDDTAGSLDAAPKGRLVRAVFSFVSCVFFVVLRRVHLTNGSRFPCASPPFCPARALSRSPLSLRPTARGFRTRAADSDALRRGSSSRCRGSWRTARVLPQRAAEWKRPALPRERVRVPAADRAAAGVSRFLRVRGSCENRPRRPRPDRARPHV